MPLNDEFVYQPPQEPLLVLYEDEDLVIIDKPAELLSVPGRLPEHHDSAYYRVLAQFPDAKITHRLDMAAIVCQRIPSSCWQTTRMFQRI